MDLLGGGYKPFWPFGFEFSFYLDFEVSKLTYLMLMFEFNFKLVLEVLIWFLIGA